MRRRSFIRNVVGATASVGVVPMLKSKETEEREEEILYRVQLHRAADDDEVVVVSEPSEHEALCVATDWAVRSRGMELGDPAIYASIHSTLNESTFNVLRGFGHLYASSRDVYRYIDRGEAHVLR